MAGKLYGGRWRTQEPLGEGGQAHAYVVVDEEKNDSTHYVLKRLKNTSNPARIERFKNEVQALRSIQHPNVINIIDFDIDAEKPYFVMDYCEIGTLSSYEAWRLTLEAKLELFCSICEGVNAAHQKRVVHRDIKPDNIFLTRDHGNPRPVVADFGVSYFEDGERQTLLDEAVGARNFMAPELEDGRVEDVTPASDVYSLGKLLYWLCSGGRIFSREKHRNPEYDLAQQSSIGLVTKNNLEHINLLLDNMIIPEPEGRLKDANEVCEKCATTLYLIKGGYAPRSDRVKHICRYCGSGVYQYVLDGESTNVHNFGFTAVGRPVWHAMQCNHCGHIELFRVNTWWGPK